MGNPDPLRVRLTYDSNVGVNRQSYIFEYSYNTGSEFIPINVDDLTDYTVNNDGLNVLIPADYTPSYITEGTQYVDRLRITAQLDGETVAILTLGIED